MNSAHRGVWYTNWGTILKQNNKQRRRGEDKWLQNWSPACVCNETIKNQRARKASVCWMFTNFQVSFSITKWWNTCELFTVISTICAIAWKSAQKSLNRNRNIFKQKHFQKQIPQRGQKPQRSHLRPISIGLLEIRPQTTHVTKICSLEWGAAQASFLGCVQGKLQMEEFEWIAVLLNLVLFVVPTVAQGKACW